MGNLSFKGKDLQKIGYTSNKAKSIALNIVSKHLKHTNKDETLILFKKLLKAPEQYINHPFLGQLANEFLDIKPIKTAQKVEILTEPKVYQIFGKKFITPNTIAQMEQALLLPVAEKGALMPDAHHGYGLPIGGVLATKNAVIPYGVGVDIGCSMRLSVFDANAKFLKRYHYQLKTALKDFTHFGIKQNIGFKHQHGVLDRKEFFEIPLAKKLHGKAALQLGTSGSGNHFVEFGIVDVKENNELKLPGGNYLGLLSHSGSRGFGAEIAKTYSQIAREKWYLPKELQHLSWLDLDTEDGAIYWQLMNLAGDYAKACHETMHHKLAKELGLKEMANVSNLHNFAWKEKHNGEEYIVHRKGATPASDGTLGIIPGSMTSKAYLIRGLGNAASLNSASHGAGRKLSRSNAKDSITMSELTKHLNQEKVTLIGGGVDESPFAYKDIEQVMHAQKELVEVFGTFQPSIVRMDKQ